MELKFWVFVQEQQDGSATARVLDGPSLPLPPWERSNGGLTNHASSRAEAIGGVAKVLERHLAVRRQEHAASSFNPRRELRTLDVDLVPRGKFPHAPIPITVSLLVTTEQSRRGTRYVVTAPRFDTFHLVVTDPAQIEEQARAALQHHTRKWTGAAILESDQTGPESLEIITVTVPDTPPKEDEEPAPIPRRLLSSGKDDDDDDEDKESVLGTCGLNLSAQAANDRLSRADRRDELVERMMQALAGTLVNSVVLVGEPGVGKTAILHEVIRRIDGGAAPPSLHGREVWFLTGNNLIAGMSYIGEWQGRVARLIREVRAGRQILYLGEPIELLEVGQTKGSDNNIGRFLRPHIESGELLVVCECTPAGYAAALAVDPSFVHAFTRIDVAETDDADTHAILQASARRLEATYRVSIHPAAIASVMELTRRFMPYRAFPGKAVSLLQEMVRAIQPSSGASEATRTLGRADAVGSFTRATGLPTLILADEMEMREDEVRAFFEERLLGQPDAVRAMVDLVTVIKAGLNDPHKPLGSFFFVGPTGVGKTELAKVLATYLFGSADRLIRFDMSEYATDDALPKLIGSAWQQSEGLLTRRVREQPFCVVLLDELEKAHRGIFDALLAVLGEGRLTDASGRTADFRNAIIIMTSNLGASRKETEAIGLRQSAADAGDDRRLASHFRKEAESFFRPEFFNRIDRIVSFRPLTLEAMRTITQRELGKLVMRAGITRRNLLIEPFDEAVIELLLRQGFHPLYGARPLQREIERMVSLPLARLVVNQQPDPNQVLRFSVHNDAIQLNFVRLDPEDEVGEELPAPSVPEQRVVPELQAVLRAIRDVQQASADEEAGPLVQRMRGEVSSLLRRTHQPSFWDTPAAARTVLSRIYHLEQVLKRLDAVAERADYLLERGRLIRVHRDRRGVPAIAQDTERLATEFAYVQMELVGVSAGTGRNQALLRVTPIGEESEEWANELMEMYQRWATRKGYDCTAIDLADTFAASPTQRRRQAAAPPALFIQGNNVYEFLRGEAGLHRLATGPAEARQRRLARVTVLLAPLEDVDPERLQTELKQVITTSGADPERRNEAEGVARVYQQGRHRSVRDPRTGVRIGDVAAVLQAGQIDAFLLATLRKAADERSVGMAEQG